MIGDFLLTTEDTDPFVDDPQQLIPSSCWDDGSTPMILPLHPTIQNQQGDNNDIPPHLSSILLKGTPHNSSVTLVAWAMALAHRIDRRHNCPQCQSHPETCQCNHVDVILCRPSPQQQPAQQPQQEQEPTNSSNNNNSNDTLSLLLDRLRASNNNASSTTMSETQQRHALGRIRVHTVQTRSEFLQCILSLQHRPMTEQPRYGILVDQLASLMMPPYATTTSNNHHHMQQQRHYPYPYPSSSSSLVDSIMALSQLGESLYHSCGTLYGSCPIYHKSSSKLTHFHLFFFLFLPHTPSVAFLMDTAQWIAHVQQCRRHASYGKALATSSTTATGDDDWKSSFVVALSSDTTNSTGDETLSLLHRRLAMFFGRIVECPTKQT